MAEAEATEVKVTKEQREDAEYEQRVMRRVLNLLEVGFTMEQIMILHPERRSFDWHCAATLIKAGCDPATAVRILT